jgi:arsenate reductase
VARAERPVVISSIAMSESALYPKLVSYIEGTTDLAGGAPAGRASSLDSLASYVAARTRSARECALVFVCTHNSRRSQLAQVWAQAAAAHYGATGLRAFSGGTEATALYPAALAALGRAGFRIVDRAGGANPVYEVSYSDGYPPLKIFSKLLGSPPNPKRDFCAVMTCSAADRNCPVVPGASMRVSIPYEDPGVFDGTERERAAYDALCRHVCGDMLYAFSRVMRGEG